MSRNLEQEYNEVLKCVEVDMLLKSVERLEQRIKRKYFDYDYPQVQYPSYYGNYPYQLDEIKGLLELIHGLLRRLENYLKSKGVYSYYSKYFKPYYDLFSELCQYYQIDIEQFEGYKNFKQLLSKGELEEFEKVERVAELVNRPELIEQWKRKYEWSHMSLEQKLAKLVDKWWKQKQEAKLSKSEPKYGAYTVSEWIEKLNLTGKGKKLAEEKPWMLTTPAGRHVLKQIDKRVIIYDD